jgi:hypothetical protein
VLAVCLTGVPVGPAVATAGKTPAAKAASTKGPAGTSEAGRSASGSLPGRSACSQSPRSRTGDRPWSLTRLSPNLVWPISTGSGQIVALISTGVDARNRQFGRGQVLPGTDVISGSAVGRADNDCDGRGTFAAGLIAAREDIHTPVVGLAPGATILPIRATQTMDQGSDPVGGPPALAAGIDYAVAKGAKIVCITVATPGGSPALQASVQAAIRAGAIVVSAGDPGSGAGAGATYPSAYDYPEVVAVGAVGRDGALVRESQRGPEIDLAAPGTDLWSTSAGGQAGALAHTDLRAAPAAVAASSAAFVAATAALVWAARPNLSPAQVVARLEQTADRSTPGRSTDGTGWGVVNPLAAVTKVIPDETGAAAAVIAAPAGERLEPKQPDRPDPITRRSTVLAVLAGTTGVTLLLAGRAAVRTGRRRGWRPARRPLP